ncbi:sulfotransferase [Caulobacter sp. 17J65-9]|uniref:tetratricopeptide repeat-containing sulfotransferase family protein n=1 Tax=Caulobacter sp. 17J65-9 TaxID=2709382 RepID=UPI0013CDD180|nr:sulfotransferase [Caulobacter sp. 17J65-9]NEX91480.1 sulfotransferase family protein [Caulobacter sp. 17J65-9]
MRPPAPAVDIDRGVAEAVGRLAQMRLVAERTARANPRDGMALNAVGNAYRMTGARDLALGFFRLAAQLQPGVAEHHYQLGVSLQFAGEFDEAARAFERTLALSPTQHQAWFSLVSVQKQTPERNHLERLEALFAGPDADGMRTLHVGHALAKTYEDLGEAVRSFEWLQKAKAVKRRRSGYAWAQERALFEAAKRTAEAAPAPGDPSGEPIFVVGLPRTGTTLVDRIISSHPDVASAGELGHFPLIAKRLAGTPGPLSIERPTFEALGRVDPARLGRAYVDSTRPLTGQTPRFVDKAPINVLFAALMHRALPNARIVCVRRDPVDACVSNFRQIFPTVHPYYDYVYDLQNTARQVALFEDLAEHWRAVLPAERYTEIRYEDLVENQEAETRRLLAFCGLSWDERCLAFHENKAAVATPSAAQVRAPIYKSSMGRWRRYGDLVAPAVEILARAGLAEADGSPRRR